MAKVLFKQWGPFAVLLIIAILALFIPLAPNFDEGKYSGPDIAFVLIAAALVFLMTPGLAFFYGGMVHRKNVLSTMIKSVVAAGVISVLWVVVSFSLAFGDTIGGFIGNPKTFFFFQGVNSSPSWSLAATIPLSLFAVFQLMFAIITPGLVVGAVAERIRFTSYILFIVLFCFVRVLSVSTLDMASRRTSFQNGRTRLCWWYGCTHLCRYGCFSWCFGFKTKKKPSGSSGSSTSKYSLRIDRYRITLVRLVRFQRGICFRS